MQNEICSVGYGILDFRRCALLPQNAVESLCNEHLLPLTQLDICTMCFCSNWLSWALAHCVFAPTGSVGHLHNVFLLPLTQLGICTMRFCSHWLSWAFAQCVFVPTGSVWKFLHCAHGLDSRREEFCIVQMASTRVGMVCYYSMQ